MSVKYASSLTRIVGGGEMRTMERGAFERVVTRLGEFVFGHRRRHRPVRYGGRTFSAPQMMTEAILPREPGIYAIQLCNFWGRMNPVHFGASHDLHEELAVDGPMGFVHWLTLGGAKRGIFVSYVAEPDLDHHARHQEGARLNRHCFPGRTHSVDEHLAHHRIHRYSHFRR
jgi:hypothetical protein